MADRILAAMDYLDVHSKAIPPKLKQRALGDIDGKYSVLEPLLEISYYPAIKSEVPLSGVRKTNPSNDRSPEDIVEEDRERMVQSAERARSAPAPFKDSNMTTSTRPMTSSSWVTGGSREVDRHVHHSILTSSSHASIKRLSFTSPAVKVGPADVRDEIMDEIVNKPLVFHRNNIKSQSAPPSGRVASSVLKSAGTRSSRWAVSPKRARTSLYRRRRGAKSWEKNPGPFMTVKVTGKDLWVVSNSTPTSYFTDKKDDGLRETSGMNGTKVTKWEDTAEAVPKAEQMSPPRHERSLGAPAQFAPTIQWLRYDPSSPPKKPPVLTPFRDGRYYNVESDLSKKVSDHLDASPGVRIARNGEVLAHSMKLESVGESDPESVKESDSEGSDIDVASLIPAKLAAKIRKHYGTPENESQDEEYDEEQESDDEKSLGKGEANQISNGNDEDSEVTAKNGDNFSHKMAKEDHENDSGHDSEETSDLSSMSGNDERDTSEHNIKEDKNQRGSLLTKDSLALLTNLAGHDLKNPLVDDSNASATSFEGSLESYELNDFLEQNGIKVDSPRVTNGHVEQEDVWRILENATPNFWITKSKQQKLAILKRLRRQRKSEQIASTRESLKSATTRDDANGNEVILPLCWEDEVNKSNTKIVHVRSGVPTSKKQTSNTSLPVVFHKVIRYDVLPTATVTSPFKPSVSAAKSRPRSASTQAAERVTFGLNGSRGYRAPVSTPRSNRSLRTKSASVGSPSTASSVRNHSAPQSLVNGTEIVRQSIDLADLLRVTPDSFPAKTSQVTTRAHTVYKEHVTVVHDDISETEMQSVRKAAAQSMKNRSGESDPNERKPSSGYGNRTSENMMDKKERNPAPVGTLNLSGIDGDATTNDTTTFSSQRPGDIKSSFTTPYNTPKTPVIHHSIALTPKTSARGQHSDSIRLGIEGDIERSGEVVHEGIPLTSKAISGVQDHGGSATRSSLSARARHGLTSVPLTRLKSGSSRGTAGHHGVSGSRPLKALPNLQTVMTNGVAELPLSIPAVQLGTQSATNGLTAKTADFIQITQSLHISDRSGAQGDAPAVTGNKMYDSYMRELAAHTAGESEERNDPRALIVGKGLGGTSGKPSSFSFPRSVKKNLSYRQSQQNQSMFTLQGRRSGLAMTPQDNSQKLGPFGLGVKGDQVRLNIDKNIHNIYRDLGLLKNAGAGANDQPTGSPRRSHQSSARSRATHREDSVISIPTASEPSVAKAPQNKPTTANSETTEEAKTKRPSSSNPSVIVQDSGTQWSGRAVKFDDAGSLESYPTQQTAKEYSTLPSMDVTSSGVVTADDTQPANSREETAENDSQEIITERTDRTERDSMQKSPTSEHSLARGVSRTSDVISVPESSQGSQQQVVVQRSASETLLDRLAEMGDRDESSDGTEEETEEPEVADVKGVTRVTVNVQTNTEGIS